MFFSEGSLCVSLKDEDYAGPEAIYAESKDGKIWVFN
jgi:hypothetical protein